jgi:hypothetical protein
MWSLQAPPRWCRLIPLLAAVLLVPAWGFAGPTRAQTTPRPMCPHRFAVSAAEPSPTLAYCARQSLDVPDAAARRAVVVIHGDERDPGARQRDLERAATAAGVSNALVVAPQFVTEQDARAHDLGDEMPSWSNDGWKYGDQSRPPVAGPSSPAISSFAVVDELLRRLADRAQFPNLEQIVIAGHSAGGQFVHRFAAGSVVEEPPPPLGIRLRYIVANPSSYLYFDDRRPVAERVGEVAVPSAAVLAACPRYNAYPYGLDNLNQHLRVVGKDALEARYASRNVVFLLGERDDDPQSPSLSTTCAANLQGAHRLERGNLFYAYLGQRFEPALYTRQPKAIIPDAGHSANAIFNSATGRAYLFERDPAPPALAPSP